MTVLRGFLITIGTGIAFAIFGGLVGYALGWAAPDFYRTMFQHPEGISIEFDPVQLGIGLGVTQGLMAGLVVGMVIVVSVAWFNSRVTENRIGGNQECPTKIS